MRRLILPGCGLLVLAAFAALYAADHPLYMRVLTVLMCRPFPHPFIDWQWIPSAAACWAKGVDVYQDNTCYSVVRHARHAYSPLWLRAHFLSTSDSATARAGLGLAACFYLSLGLLPTPRGRRGWLVTLAAAFSCMPAFALERGNIDIIMFLLVIGGTWLWVRPGPVRALGYACLGCAGLLKFYPFALAMLFLRERLTVFFALCAALAGVIGAFVLRYGTELKEVSGNVPPVPYFTDGFGSRQFPGGCRIALQYVLQQLGLDNAFVQGLPDNAQLALGVYAVLLAGMVGLAVMLARRADMRCAMAALRPPALAFLVSGATLMCFCFIVADNVSYRGIYFLLVLPGLLAIAGDTGRFIRGLGWCACCMTLVLMWGLALQQAVAGVFGGTGYPMGGSVAVYAYWAANQAAWWFVMTVLLGMVFCFIEASTMWRTAGRLLGRGEAPA